MPSVDDLFALASFWDGDKGKLPNGDSYWKFMIFKHRDQHTYVLENHLKTTGSAWTLEQVVKRLW
jgi:hypothetical protein